MAPQAGVWHASLVVPLGPAAPGITDVVARVTCPGDPLPENDLARCGTRAGPELVCAVIVDSGRREEVRRWLVAGAAAEGAASVASVASVDGGLSALNVDPVVVDGLQLRFWEVEELGQALVEADVLWTCGVAPDRLDGRLLASFVEYGGGWLASGGWDLLQGWLPQRGRQLPQALLPLEPPEGDAERDVILLVDGSGSMAGGPFELVRRGVLELARASLAGDHLSLRFFTGVLGPQQNEAVLPGAGTRRATLLGILAARVPGGTTDVLYSLDQLVAERGRQAERRAALALLLTDGHTASSDAERTREVSRKLVAAGVQLRVFPIGEQADRQFLGQLVAPGESLVEVGELSEIGELFQREVNQARIREGAAIGLTVVGSESGAVGAGQARASAVGDWGGLDGAWPGGLPPL
ncbi:MAG: VWA domain-containing protein, partial [Planctomycetota bacterium]|nr:VWA domain-containing protein [Planctomycetota bacterium]